MRALPTVLAACPDARVLFTGAYKDTVGEEQYWQRLAPLLERHRQHLVFLELLPASAMPAFYALCDVVAVTSLNSTEAFGMVQVEAMLCGTPVVATDLPGVREAVRRTGMGRIVPLRDPDALAAALIDVRSTAPEYVRRAQPCLRVRPRALADRLRAIVRRGQRGAAHRTVIVVRYGTALFPIAIGR